MSSVHIASVIAVNASCVVVKRLGNSNRASNWASLVNLLKHIVLTLHEVVLINMIDTILVGDVAGLTRITVAANVHG